MGEGDSGLATITFTVTKSGAAAGSVRASTADDTARAGSDYVARSQELVFTAADRSKTFSVTVNGDTVDEADEAFLVDLSDPSQGASLADPQATGTIVDDDTALLSIGDLEVREGDDQPVVATLAVALSTPSSRPVSVRFATADDTATRGDYRPVQGQLRFAPGETSRSIEVRILSDRRREPTERLLVKLSDPVNAGLLDQQAVVTIIDQDGREVEAPARARPSVTASTTPRRGRQAVYRFITRGRVIPPRGLDPRTACADGRVRVKILKRRSVLSTRQVKVRPDCSFRARNTLRRPAAPGKVRVRARFLGTRQLKPRSARTHTVTAR